MSHDEMKQSGSRQKGVALRDSQENPYKTMKLAEELIRALDAESDEHMQQISAEDKLTTPSR